MDYCALEQYIKHFHTISKLQSSLADKRFQIIARVDVQKEQVNIQAKPDELVIKNSRDSCLTFSDDGVSFYEQANKFYSLSSHLHAMDLHANGISLAGAKKEAQHQPIYTSVRSVPAGDAASYFLTTSGKIQ